MKHRRIQEGSTFQDVARADLPPQVELGAANPSGLTTRRKAALRALSWLVLLLVQLWALSWWMAELPNKTFEIADRAALELDDNELSLWWDGILREGGYRGRFIDPEDGAVGVVMIDFYTQVLDILLNQAEPTISWDVTAILPLEMRVELGEGERFILELQDAVVVPDQLVMALEMATQYKYILTGLAAAMLIALGVIAGGGGPRGLGWTMRRLGLWMIGTTALTVAGLLWRARQAGINAYPLTNETLTEPLIGAAVQIGWFPFYAVGLLGVILLGLGLGLAAIRRRPGR